MKKLTTILSAIALVISTSAFAYNGGNATKAENVTKAVENSFQQNFTGAVNVSWQKADEFYFASFELNEKRVEAAYNDEGALIGTLHTISREQLPAVVGIALKQQYGEYNIGASIDEIDLLGEKNYYINVENKNEILRLKCSPDGQQIGFEKRIAKKKLVGKIF